MAADYSHIITYIIYMVSDVRIKFAERLKFLREERNLSQEKLALLCDINFKFLHVALINVFIIFLVLH